MSDKIQIPATSASAQPCVVPDHFKLADSLQLALVQLGDGFFPFKGSMGVNLPSPATRNIKDLNGEVIPGTGLAIKVRDYLALVDGIVLGGKNVQQFAPDTFTTLAVATGTSYVVLSAKRIVGTDGLDRPDYEQGLLSVQSTPASYNSGYINVAKLVIPAMTTQVLSGMIDLSTRQYLVDLGDESRARIGADAALAAQIGAVTGTSDLQAEINIAKTNFKIDTLLSVNANNLFNGFVDVFSSDGDIDAGASTGYVVDAAMKQVEVAPAGLIAEVRAYFKMDEADGTTVLLDEMGGISASYPAGSRVAGVIGNGIRTGTVGSEASLANTPFDLNGTRVLGWTAACWFKINTGIGQSGGALFGNVVAGSAVYGDGSGWFYPIVAAGGSYVASSPGDLAAGTPTVADNAWHHCAVTFLTDTLYFYIDGVLVSSAVRSQWFGHSHTFAFGARGAGDPVNFSGDVDEMAFLARALTAGELLAIHSQVNLNSGNGTTATVVSKAHTAPTVPATATIVAEGTNDLTLSFSRDNGVTWTVIPNNTQVSVAGQPSGSQVRYKAALPAATSVLDNIAVFWK